MIAFQAYMLLLSITILFGWLVWRIWMRTRDLSVPAVAAIVYLWTFMGAWFFIGDAAAGFQGFRIGLSYYYLMDKMFPFVLDEDYLVLLGAYGLFAFPLLGAMFAVGRQGVTSHFAPVPVSRDALMITGIVLFAIALIPIAPMIRTSFEIGRPVYQLVHEWNGPGKTVHLLSATAAITAFLLGWSIRRVSGTPGALFMDTFRWFPGWSYAAGAVALCVVLSLTGNRHSVFGALILAVIYLLEVGRKAGIRHVKVLLIGGSVALVLGGAVRNMTWTDAGLVRSSGDAGPFSTPEIRHVPRQPQGSLAQVGRVLFTNELFSAHFSFYGIRKRLVEPVPWISFSYLAGSLLPASERPPTAYDLYAEKTGLLTGQGYAIHHASAWYLNAGWVGIPLGGAMLGFIWVLAVRFGQRHAKAGWPRLLPWLFAAFLPVIMRTGPEALKSLSIEGFMLPLFTLAPALWCGVRWSARARASTDPGHG